MEHTEITDEARRLFVEIIDRYHIIPRVPSTKPSNLVELLTDWFVYIAAKAEEEKNTKRTKRGDKS